MNIVITGSLGNISRPLTKELVQKGHSVTVISRKAERQPEIEAIGAKAAIGSMEDVAFLTSVFAGADAVYCMEAAPNFFDHSFDFFAFCRQLGAIYIEAIQKAGVKRVVHLSSIGAHMDKGNGLLLFHHEVENIFRQLPSEVAISFLRPVGFYYNLYAFVPSIKTQGLMASNYGADDLIPWVSPIDIATVAAEELTTPFAGRKIRYIASEEITCNEIARILGEAIGKPDLKWELRSSEQVLGGMLAAGMNPTIAKGLVEMNEAIHSGVLYEDYYRNRPELGKTKIKDFAQQFAQAYLAGTSVH